MSLKESEQGLIGGFKGRKSKRFVIIISKIKEKKRFKFFS